MSPSPYDDSRSADAAPYVASRSGSPPDDWLLPLLPSIAIIGNVPTPDHYADPLAAGAPLVVIAVAFHRMFDGPQRLKKSILALEGWEKVKSKTVQNDVYVNFGQYDLLHYVKRVPGSREFGSFNVVGFLKLILNRYNTYEVPRTYDFCVKDESLALSTKMINSLTNQKKWPLKKEKGSGSEIVLTLTEALSRQNSEDHAYYEAFFNRFMAIEMCYDFKEWEFSAVKLMPPPDVDEAKYFEIRESQLVSQVSRLNALLNLLQNYGNPATGKLGSPMPLHPDFVTMTDSIEVEIGGHTDRMGEPDAPGKAPKFDNEKLSKQRAQGIVEHIKATTGPTISTTAAGSLPNLLSDRLVAKGYGADECIALDPSKPPQQDRACRKVTVRIRK